MTLRWRAALVATAVLTLVTGMAASPAGADHVAAQHKNMQVMFESPNATGATNSDLAFWGNLAFAANYNSLRIFDISTDPPTLVSNTPCDGPQNDVSVWDRDGDGAADILFVSVDSVMENDICGAPRQSPVTGPYDPDDWEGIRIFDITNPALPVQVDTVYQDCGSHTHTLVPDPEDNRVLLYNSSYPLRVGPTCGPGNAPDPLHSRIQVVEVRWSEDAPLNNASLTAAEIAEPRVVYPGDPDNRFDPCDAGGTLCEPAFHDLTACHDIGVFLPLNLAGAACAEQAQLWRIDPETLLPDSANPVWVYDDEEDIDGAGGGDVSVDFWHSATFSWDGKVINFVDESFGNGCPTVTINQDPEGTRTGPSDTGANFFLSTASGQKFSHIQSPRTDERGYCSAHLGNTVPAPGRNLLVTASYNGGAQVIDYTAPRNPKLIAWWDWNAPSSNNWSHYWYETSPKSGTPFTSYGNDIGRGFQQYSINVGIGRRYGVDHLNPQTQEFIIP